MDQVLKCPVSMPFPTKEEAEHRAQELEALVVQPDYHIYIGKTKVSIESLGPDAQRQIREAFKEGR